MLLTWAEMVGHALPTHYSLHSQDKSHTSKAAAWISSHLSSCLKKGRESANSSLHYPTEACHLPDSLILWLSRWSPWHSVPFTKGKVLLGTSLDTACVRRHCLCQKAHGTNHLMSCWVTLWVLPLRLLLFFPLNLLQLFPQLGHRLGQVARDLQAHPTAQSKLLCASLSHTWGKELLFCVMLLILAGRHAVAVLFYKKLLYSN